MQLGGGARGGKSREQSDAGVVIIAGELLNNFLRASSQGPSLLGPAVVFSVHAGVAVRRKHRGCMLGEMG